MYWTKNCETVLHYNKVDFTGSKSLSCLYEKQNNTWLPHEISALVFNSTKEIPLVLIRSVKYSLIIFPIIHFMNKLLSFHFSYIEAYIFFFDNEFSVSILS